MIFYIILGILLLSSVNELGLQEDTLAIDVEGEMQLMADCSRLNQQFLPYREYVSALNELVKDYLKTHDRLPKWWSPK